MSGQYKAESFSCARLAEKIAGRGKFGTLFAPRMTPYQSMFQKILALVRQHWMYHMPVGTSVAAVFIAVITVSIPNGWMASVRPRVTQPCDARTDMATLSVTALETCPTWSV